MGFRYLGCKIQRSTPEWWIPGRKSAKGLGKTIDLISRDMGIFTQDNVFLLLTVTESQERFGHIFFFLFFFSVLYIFFFYLNFFLSHSIWPFLFSAWNRVKPEGFNQCIAPGHDGVQYIEFLLCLAYMRHAAVKQMSMTDFFCHCHLDMDFVCSP